jgi:cytochrome c oxidase subunit 1
METDHKVLGVRYVATAFLFFVLAGALAALIRLQLAVPDNTLLTTDQYDQVFTTHGVAMMFLFAVPVMDGMGIYLLPLMLGTRSIAFPRLIALSYYIFLFGGVMVFGSLLLNSGPDSGWFSYVPLSGPEYGAGKRGDIFNQLINFTEISALAVASSLVTTVFKLRAPGMTLNRIPLFAWSMVCPDLRRTMISSHELPTIGKALSRPSRSGSAAKGSTTSAIRPTSTPEKPGGITPTTVKGKR